MSSKAYPDVKVVEHGLYSFGEPGFIIVQKTEVTLPDGPLYVWPEKWSEAPERAGVFASREEAERVLEKELH